MTAEGEAALHRFKTIEHTADIGIEVEASTLPELFEGAAYAVMSLLAEPEAIEQKATRRTALEAGDLDELMFMWLNELLFILDSEGLVFSGFEVAVEGSSLSAVLLGEPIDRKKHSLKTEVKAATYHELHVGRSEENVWLARVILDV